MKKSLVPILLSLFICYFASQEKAGGHFYYSGALNQLTADGVKIGPVSSGLPFAISLTDSGAKISPTQFDLRLPGANSPIKLSFENLKFTGDHLTGTAKITNGSGSVIEGVRLDVLNAAEDFRSKDAAGNSVSSTRNQTISLNSPLFFGDLATNESSDAIAFDVSAIKFAPDTTKITVNGIVSGLRYVGAFNVKDLENPGEIEADQQGRIYICDVGGSRIARTDAEGRNAEVPVKLENQCLGVAVDPKTGDIYATTNNSKSVYHFSNTGAAMQSFDSDEGLSFLRFDRRGNLFGAASHVFRFANGKAVLEIAEATGDDLYTKGFDVDGFIGNIWIASGLEKDRSLYRASPDGKTKQKIASGPDWRLGHVDVPQSVRVDAQGNAYVVELGDVDAEEAARVSVFDKSGALVRVFGRGGRTPDPNKEKILTGQVYRPSDIAFGTSGRVYVAQENDGGFTRNLMLMFEPF